MGAMAACMALQGPCAIKSYIPTFSYVERLWRLL